MCGIVGCFDVRRRGDEELADAEALVAKAVASLHHRGPDDSGTEVIPRLGAWGMARLAIRDPGAGKQPMWFGGIGAVFNGEIYNTNEVRSLLERRGHRFATNCDTEVVVKAYVELGPAAFGQLDGIFAIAVVDVARRQLVLARDEFGVKPLFVREKPNGLAFASEPKALRAMGELDGGVDVDAIARYLCFQYVPEPDAPWVGVRRIAPGTFEVFDLDTLARTVVEGFRQPPVDLGDDDDPWADQVDRALRLSIDRQLVSDRPLGVFLSGGVDSTLISAYAADRHPGINAYGISVPGWERDERNFMTEAARHLDVDLDVGYLEEGDFLRLADRVLDVYDEPFGDYSAIPTMFVSELAGRDVRVVLSGDGGDELFGGYARYPLARRAEVLGLVPPGLLRAAWPWLSRVDGRFSSAGRIADEVAAGGHGYTSLLMLARREEVDQLLGRSSPARPTALVARQGRRRSLSSAGAIEQAMAIDTAQYLPADILTKVDRATMAVSLEARVPMLGAPVARLAERMPVTAKVNRGVGKHPLKELLLRRGFTDEFVHRPKMGFSLPISDWLRRAFVARPDYQDALRRPPSPLVASQTSRHLDLLMQGADNGHLVWTLLMLARWLGRQETVMSLPPIEVRR